MVAILVIVLILNSVLQYSCIFLQRDQVGTSLTLHTSNMKPLLHRKLPSAQQIHKVTLPWQMELLLKFLSPKDDLSDNDTIPNDHLVEPSKFKALKYYTSISIWSKNLLDQLRTLANHAITWLKRKRKKVWLLGKFGVAFYIVTIISKRALQWYKGMSDYEVLLDHVDQDFHIYGASPVDSIIIPWIASMNQSRLDDHNFQPLQTKIIRALERPCFPLLMKDYSLQIGRDLASILSEMDFRLREFQKKINRFKSKDHLDRGVDRGKLSHEAAALNTTTDPPTMMRSNRSEGMLTDDLFHELSNESLVLTQLQHGVTLLQVKQMEACLRMIRTQILTAANTCEDLICQWKQRVLKISDTLHKPIWNLFSYQWFGFSTGIRVRTLQKILEVHPTQSSKSDPGNNVKAKRSKISQQLIKQWKASHQKADSVVNPSNGSMKKEREKEREEGGRVDPIYETWMKVNCNAREKLILLERMVELFYRDAGRIQHQLSALTEGITPKVLEQLRSSSHSSWLIEDRDGPDTEWDELRAWLTQSAQMASESMQRISLWKPFHSMDPPTNSSSSSSTSSSSSSQSATTDSNSDTEKEGLSARMNPPTSIQANELMNELITPTACPSSLPSLSNNSDIEDPDIIPTRSIGENCDGDDPTGSNGHTEWTPDIRTDTTTGTTTNPSNTKMMHMEPPSDVTAALDSYIRHDRHRLHSLRVIAKLLLYSLSEEQLQRCVHPSMDLSLGEGNITKKAEDCYHEDDWLIEFVLPEVPLKEVMRAVLLDLPRAGGGGHGDGQQSSGGVGPSGAVHPVQRSSQRRGVGLMMNQHGEVRNVSYPPPRTQSTKRQTSQVCREVLDHIMEDLHRSSWHHLSSPSSPNSTVMDFIQRRYVTPDSPSGQRGQDLPSTMGVDGKEAAEPVEMRLNWMNQVFKSVAGLLSSDRSSETVDSNPDQNNMFFHREVSYIQVPPWGASSSSSSKRRSSSSSQQSPSLPTYPKNGPASTSPSTSHDPTTFRFGTATQVLNIAALLDPPPVIIPTPLPSPPSSPSSPKRGGRESIQLLTHISLPLLFNGHDAEYFPPHPLHHPIATHSLEDKESSTGNITICMRCCDISPMEEGVLLNELVSPSSCHTLIRLSAKLALPSLWMEKADHPTGDQTGARRSGGVIQDFLVWRQQSHRHRMQEEFRVRVREVVNDWLVKWKEDIEEHFYVVDRQRAVTASMPSTTATSKETSTHELSTAADKFLYSILLKESGPSPEKLMIHTEEDSFRSAETGVDGDAMEENPSGMQDFLTKTFLGLPSDPLVRPANPSSITVDDTSDHVYRLEDALSNPTLPPSWMDEEGGIPIPIRALDDLQQQLQLSFRNQRDQWRVSSTLLTDLSKTPARFANHLEVIGLRKKPPSGVLGHVLQVFRWRTMLRLGFWTSTLLAGLEFRKWSTDIVWGVEVVAKYMKDIIDRRLTTPTMSIFNDVVLNKRTSLSDKEALKDAKRSLREMLNDFLQDSRYPPPSFTFMNHPYLTMDPTGIFILWTSLSSDISEAERKRLIANLDMSPISRAYETELRHPLRNLMTGRIARLVLIQLQFVKKELLVAMEAIDELFSANQVNIQLLAVTPAIMSAFAFQVVTRTVFSALKSSSRGKAMESTAVIHRDLRNGLRELERLLIQSRSNHPQLISETVVGSTEKIFMNEHEVGQLLSILHRLQTLLVLNSANFETNQLKQFQEDLRDMAVLHLTAAQRIIVIDRIYKSIRSVQLNRNVSKINRILFQGREVVTVPSCMTGGLSINLTELSVLPNPCIDYVPPNIEAFIIVTPNEITPIRTANETVVSTKVVQATAI